MTSEARSQDGYSLVRVPIKSIGFLDLEALEASIATGPQRERYAHYCDLIGDGHAANGVPIVYRTPKGNLIASDLRHSDVAIYVKRNIQYHPSVALLVDTTYVSVKVIEVASRDDIPIQRAAYLKES